VLILWNCVFVNFKGWISCTHFDTMFMYVKWMLNMLLLLNLHVWIVVIWNFVVFCSNWCKVMLWLQLLMNSWLNYVVVRCCCGWFMPWVFIIMRFWCELSCCWKFLFILKMDKFMNCVEMVFDSKFDMVLIAFLCI